MNSDQNEELQEQRLKDSDYQNLELQFGKNQNYEIIKKIGRGKYSDVFEAIKIQTQEKRVIKVLKPIRKQKIKREIKILQVLNQDQQGTNIIGYHEVLKDKFSKTISLVFEHVNHTDHRQAFKQFSDLQVREYMYKLLQAVDYTHSKGIMHRDIKPFNVMYDLETKQLRLIDFGLAEFYKGPKTKNNVNVCALYYKAPEILLNYEYYDYSLDMWGVGVIFAQIIFQREPFFHGCNIYDQLEKIARALGTEALQNYTNKYKIPIQLEKFEEYLVRKHDKKDWSIYASTENKQFLNKQALDLLNQMLQYDHEERIKASAALKHPYFQKYLKTLEKDIKVEK